MSVLRFGPSESADDAANRWLMAHDRGLTHEEVSAFEEWLAGSPSNAEAWDRATRMWSAFDGTPDPDLAAMREEAYSYRKPVWSRLPAQAAAVVAVVSISLGGWYLAQQYWAPSPQVASAAPSQHYSADLDRRQIALLDGSKILLDARSALDVRLTKDRRDISLTAGRAYFQVAHDPSRPFVVTAAGHAITDVGTEFSVDMDAQGVSVTLVKGEVRVTSVGIPGDAGISLRPGDNLRITRNNTATLSRIDTASTLAWRDGYLDFEDTPISEAVAQMNRYATKPLVVADPVAGAMRITGSFRTNDPVGFAQTVARLYSLRVSKRPDGRYEIKSK